MVLTDILSTSPYWFGSQICFNSGSPLPPYLTKEDRRQSKQWLQRLLRNIARLFEAKR